MTIDGPAGAGKSSAARALARRLGFQFLDTGAMYRALTLAAIQRGIDWSDLDGLLEMARRVEVRVEGPAVTLDGVDVSQRIRQPDVTEHVHHVADHPGIREHLVGLQRTFADERDIVTEGRDQGTVVFPDAECKIFLTASAEERARRRRAELVSEGESLSVEDVLQQQEERDRRDSTRQVGRLVEAEDAVRVMTDGLTQEAVVDRLEELVRSRPGFPHRASGSSPAAGSRGS